MAVSYRATIDLRGWKEHTCCGCGAGYRYRFRRKQTGYGATEKAATAAATAAAVRTVEGTVKQCPCPRCGEYPPEMIAARRSRRHFLLFLATLFVFGALYVLGETGLLSLPVVLYLLALLASLILVGNVVVGLLGPNGDLEANKAYARQLLQEGALQPAPVDPDEKCAPARVRDATGFGFWVAFLLLSATLLLILGAELVRGVNGWPLNVKIEPPALGPGDTARIALPQRIESVQGRWKATARARALNAKELNLPSETLSVQTRDAGWGTEITARYSEDQSGAHPWVDVQLPAVPELEHKALLVELTVKATYPVLHSERPDEFQDREQDFTHTVTLHLGSPSAGMLYRTYWRLGILGGGAMFLLASGFYLSRDAALRRCGQPTRVIPMDRG
jgi:hypothetical protein